MTLDLSTYERGYYGYMNQEVRDALGELQDTGAVRAIVASASELASMSRKFYSMDLTRLTPKSSALPNTIFCIRF